MAEQPGIFIGKGTRTATLLSRYANRHGLITGATGTGKTVSLQRLAGEFSRLGVPVFLADVKGDLSGLAVPGSSNQKLDERLAFLGMSDLAFEEVPTVFWDVYGEQGHPVRTTISEMGPMLLSRVMDLNDTQEAVLTTAFRYSDDEGLLLLDFKDLRTTLQFIGDHRKELKTRYGNISTASVGTVQARLLMIEEQGGDRFFGEPALSLTDLMQLGDKGYGRVNILAAEKLIRTPRLYTIMLLWLLSELFETLPEVGDQEKPRLVFFFDEAHLLFNDAPKILLERVEQMVKLIRSKGVGVYFVTQSPLDVPDGILGQLGNRVQHALRAFTPRDEKSVRVAARTFRQNPDIDTASVITQLGVGEALVSFLEDDGIPGMVDRVLIAPPRSRIGALSGEERQQVIRRSRVFGRYETAVDRESAHEKLSARVALAAEEEAKEKANSTNTASSSSGSRRQSAGEALLKSVARSVGSQIGRRLVRGLLGSLLRGR